MPLNRAQDYGSNVKTLGACHRSACTVMATGVPHLCGYTVCVPAPHTDLLQCICRTLPGVTELHQHS